MQPNNDSAFILAIISGIGTVVLGILQWIQTIKKNKSQSKVENADATHKIGDAYSTLLEHMRKQIDELENDVKYLKNELRKYAGWTAILLKQLNDHDIVPEDPPTNPQILIKDIK